MVAQSTYVDPIVSVKPKDTNTDTTEPPKQKGLFGDAGKKFGEAIGITGDGTKESPVKLWGMEIDGEDGILSDLAALTKAVGGENDAPVPQMLQQPRLSQQPQKPIQLASSVFSPDDEKKKKLKHSLFALNRGPFYG
ncbi:hypothetical protein A6U96_13980 [Agrobacterium tumefaciens]|nr:hypothetical protein A6U96_13980 [Agrobacterium tumefaciens]